MERLKDFKRFKLHAAKIALLMYVKLGDKQRKSGGLYYLLKNRLRFTIMVHHLATKDKVHRIAVAKILK